MSLLDRIQSPADIRTLSNDEMRVLADDVRAFLIESCSVTGGHIGAGLGVVELTIALHNCFDTPRDQLVWDVGHQGYPHKVLTGRAGRMDTLRQEDGLSGFLKRSESEYDAFGAGHAATSISAAYGMAVGRDLAGEDFKVVAVIGDGSLGSGLAYEGLNNAGASEPRFHRRAERQRDVDRAERRARCTSISRRSSATRSTTAFAARSATSRATRRACCTPRRSLKKWEESVKAFLTPGVLFEELGFRYFGPIDGHDIKTAERDVQGRARDEGAAPRPRRSRRRERDSPPASTARSGTRCRRDTIPRRASSSRPRPRTRTTRRSSARGSPSS